jgi:phosphatidylinositol alpha-1,6-mannosyltransferase
MHLLISENFPPKVGGSCRYLWEIYRRLPRENCLIAAGETSRDQEYDATHDLRVRRIPLTMSAWGLRSVAGLKGYWRAFKRLRPLVRAERIRLVHSGRNLPEGTLALALKRWHGVPYVCYVHGEDVNETGRSRELAWLTRRVLNGAAIIIVSSHNAERLVKEDWGIPSKRICLVYPGVDCERFVPCPRDPAVRDRLGWRNRPVVLTVGRLQKRKGQDQMILAMRTIRKAIPQALYAIAGDGEERATLEGIVAREGLGEHVQFLGELPDSELLYCYQQCDLFTLPNRQVGKDIEGFGMVLLEAQACSKPVIAGASGGTAETMKIPETGRTVCCDGPDDLAALVIEFLSNPELLERMGKAARPWVLEHFDWSVLTRQAEDAFRRALAT